MLSDKDIDLFKQLARHKKLLQMAKSLYLIYSMQSRLLQSIENKAELLRANQDLILEVLIKTKPELGLKRVLQSFGISEAQMYYWLEKKRCKNSVFQLCQSRYPNQLLPLEVEVIKSYLSDDRFKHWSILSIYYQALRDKAVSVGLGTWYKYANRLGIKRAFFKRNKKSEIGVRASSPLQMLHMDVTIFKPMDHSKVYTYLIADNFSRTILNWKASLKYSSSIALSLLKETI